MVWAGEYWPIEGEDYVGVDGVNPMAVTGLPHWGPARPGDEYLTDRLTRKAVEFIQRNRWKDFFLYLAYNGPHDPWQLARRVPPGSQSGEESPVREGNRRDSVRRRRCQCRGGRGGCRPW